MTESNPHLNDRELEALAMQIDRLAFSDQNRDGLETRITAATLPLLQRSLAAHPALRLVGSEASGIAAATAPKRSRFSRVPMRMAAGLALMATAGLTWMASRQPGPLGPASTMPIAVIGVSSEDWAMASSLLDDDLSDKISELHDETSSLGTSIRSQGLSEMLEEGAM